MSLLDILIPTIPSRRNEANLLRGKLLRQIEVCEEQWGFKLGFVVIMVENEPYLEGGLSIGEVRQSLLEMSKSEYLCFLDDDDDIAPNYISLIYQAIENKGLDTKPDVVTFWVVAEFDNMTCVVDMSIHHINEQAHCSGLVKRTAWHINPIKSSIAKQSEFPSINYGEDYAYMEKLLPLIKTELHYDTVLHYYKHSASKSEADKITNHV